MPELQSTAGAVFLSYAREDSEAARRIADALRAFGLEVWLDQSELRGGDSWDAKIKTQIRTCALFLPIISAHTQKRAEGYFRREWKFGVERTHDMASGTAFVVPVVIDDTMESSALVPEEFMRFQWTRLPHGVPTAQFVEQVKQLLSNPRIPSQPNRAPSQPAPQEIPAQKTGAGLGLWVLGGAMMVVAVLLLVISVARRPAASSAIPTPAPAAALAPVASPSEGKSVAVLPFANFSPDKDNEFFAEGLQDEVITALAKIHDLKVISRTSVLAYKNPEGRNLKKIGDELGVTAVLEGSVQRVGTKMHLNVQLIDARTDDHLWAESYTEEMTDVFSVEAGLAKEIATALRANLTPGERALIDQRPTQSQEAYDLYLRARVLAQDMESMSTRDEYESVLALYAQSEAKDPSFALPHAQASILHGDMFWFSEVDASPERRAKAQAELEEAQRLAPDAPETHLAQGEFEYACVNDWTAALREYRAAAAGLPGSEQAHGGIARAYRRLGQFTEALAEFRRAAELNPNEDTTAYTVAETTYLLHRYQAVVDLCAQYHAKFPKDLAIRQLGIIAQFEIDGDRAAYLKAITAVPALFGKQWYADYLNAFDAGDMPAAERALSDPAITQVSNGEGAISDPAALPRAFVAYVLGKHEQATAYANEAIYKYQHESWTQRQQPWVHMGIARAEAFAGRNDEAARDGKAALDELAALDAFGSIPMRYQYGELLVVVNKREEALATLREIVALPLDAFSPNQIRYGPIWSRLKDDPRFEEILRSIKPL